MQLQELNSLGNEELRSALLKCCGSLNWVNAMMKYFPFNSGLELFQKAEEVWCQCNEND